MNMLSHWKKEEIRHARERRAENEALATRASAKQDRAMPRAEWYRQSSRARFFKRLRDWPNSYTGRRWRAESSICPNCGRSVTNGAYWGSNGKGSAHFKKTCKPEAFKLPRQSWKSKLAYPMPPMGNPWNQSVQRPKGREEDNLTVADLVVDRKSFEAFWRHEIRLYIEREAPVKKGQAKAA